MARLREQVRAEVRNEPGVYVMHGVHGDVLYVGKSTRVRTRLLSYFRLAWPEHRHARLLRETARITWEPLGSEFAALLREVRLIRAHLPRYNVRSARPLDRWWVVTVGGGPAPRLRIQRASAALRTRGASAVIGPFAARAPLADALRVVNDALGLRDCADRVPLVLRDAGDLFADDARLARTPGCHRYETRRCLGPCVAATDAASYRVQLGRALAVFEGTEAGPREALLSEMAAASAALSYERAGWLRDRLAALEALDDQLARVREALARPTMFYAVPERDGRTRVYLIADGGVAGEAMADDPDALDRLERMRRQGVPRATGVDPRRLDEMLLVEQWFRARPEELSRTAGLWEELQTEQY